ncbi:MAG: hypothetical protein J6P94_03780, partial [Oscillospiraceae bacterium]|nr:hypothetical protein [Oscillospiraceae bacterium]
TVNGKAVECRAEWSMLKDTMDGYSIPTDTLEEGNDYLVFVYYNAGTTADDENLNITVEGAQYDYSDTFGDEVMTAAHVNLMEEGNMVIVCSGVAPGAPLNPYMVILKDGERVPFNYNWTVTDEEGTAPADASTIVEYGKAYDVHLEIFPREEFKLEDYSVSANCGDGVLSAVSQEGNVVYASLTYAFSMPFVYVKIFNGVNIHVASDQIGTPLSAVPVYVQHAGLDVPCHAQWQVLTDDAYAPASGTLEAGKAYRVYVYYTAELTDDELAADMIHVSGGDLDHSERAGNEILSVVSVNLLEKGNLSLNVGNTYVGMPIDGAYCSVKLDGETLPSDFSWSILKGSDETAIDNSGFFEEGNYYQISIYFTPPAGFDPSNWGVRVNAAGGELISLENAGDRYLAKIGFDYGNEHVCKFVLDENKPATNTCTEDGEAFYVCPECGEEKTKAASATGHVFDWSNAEYTAPQNCMQYGVERASCTVCGAVETRNTADKGNQIWRETAREDLCDLGVTIYYICDSCGASYNDLQPGSHNWVRIDQAGSCPYGIQLVLSCTKCGKIDTSQWLPPKDHTFGGWSYWNNHTHVSHCIECGEEVSEGHRTDSRGYCAACGSWIVN